MAVTVSWESQQGKEKSETKRKMTANSSGSIRGRSQLSRDVEEGHHGHWRGSRRWGVTEPDGIVLGFLV